MTKHVLGEQYGVFQFILGRSVVERVLVHRRAKCSRCRTRPILGSIPNPARFDLDEQGWGLIRVSVKSLLRDARSRPQAGSGVALPKILIHRNTRHSLGLIHFPPPKRTHNTFVAQTC